MWFYYTVRLTLDYNSLLINILAFFTHLQVFSDLYDLLSSKQHKIMVLIWSFLELERASKMKLSLCFTHPRGRPSDETLNRGPDSLWSLKIPGCPSKKSRGVTLASWPNFPIGLWPSWPPNYPHTLIGFITLSPLHQKAGLWWAFWRNIAAIASSR